MTIVAIVACVAWWVVVRLHMRDVALLMYQLEEYDARRLLRWMVHTSRWLYHRSFVGAIITYAVVRVVTVATSHSSFAPTAFLAAVVVAFSLWSWPKEKKPLVMTARARRLAITADVVTAVIALLLVFDFLQDGAAIGSVIAIAGLTVYPPLALIAANIVLWPYEQRSRAQFQHAAKARLREIAPTVIAVAGSYGKTTTKHLIAHVLDESGDTLPTPKSFNTLLGLTKTINDDLTPRHRVFVAEMDAYNPGEIATMCDLVQPSIAVLTSVGPQHLERFHSMDRIRDALHEVIAGLPEGGTAIVYAGDHEGIRAAERARKSGRTTISYAIDAEWEDADIVARDVQVAADGSRFRWCWKANDLEREVYVSLLGRHQVLNASAALAVAHCTNRGVDNAIQRLAQAPAVEHRLQILPTNNGVIVIDDSYNANPVGVHNALEVLEQMDVTRRVLVTPGLVELGEREEAENRRYGKHAAQVCDDVIVVSARTSAALIAGARDGGLEEAHLHLVGSLSEATATIGRIAGPGTVVLFANDLPDTY